MPIDILMGTLNGEKYIRNQLLSLEAQTCEDWRLWVRDDGSTDRTTAIVDEFASRDSRIKQVACEHPGLGAGKNFLTLLAFADGRFATFCDQDDIWFERKLEFLVEFAEQNFDERTPCLVYCDGHAYSDTEGTITSSSISHLHARALREFLFFNSGYQGCSMLFNRRLAEIANNYGAPFYLHDDIVSLIAHVFGKVYFLPKPLMLYRQHDKNLTGQTAGSLKHIAKQFFRRDAYVLNRKHFEEKSGFYRNFSTLMSVQDRALFEAYLRYPEASLLERVSIVLRNRFSVGGYRLPLILKTLLRAPIN